MLPEVKKRCVRGSTLKEFQGASSSRFFEASQKNKTWYLLNNQNKFEGLLVQGEAFDARTKLGKVTSPGPHAGPVIIGPALETCWYYGGTVSSIKSELWAGTERPKSFPSDQI